MASSHAVTVMVCAATAMLADPGATGEGDAVERWFERAASLAVDDGGRVRPARVADS